MLILFSQIMTLQTPDERDFMERLLDEYGALMLSTARRITGNDSDAEDVVQEAFVKLINHIQRLMEIPRCNLAGYVVNTVKNTSRNYLNAEAARLRRCMEDGPQERQEEREAEQSAEWILLQRETRSGFYEVWQTLPETDQILLRDKYILCMTNEEIARELDCQTDSVRMKLTRARRKAMSAYKEWRNDDQT